MLSCGVLLLLVAPQAQAATRQVGSDIPVQWYADDSVISCFSPLRRY
ncbi:hypothetical protein Q6247_26835, partial [Klebsiella pneumoniae]